MLQEIMYRAAKFVAHARRLVLDFGRASPAMCGVRGLAKPIAESSVAMTTRSRRFSHDSSASAHAEGSGSRSTKMT